MTSHEGVHTVPVFQRGWYLFDPPILRVTSRVNVRPSQECKFARAEYFGCAKGVHLFQGMPLDAIATPETPEGALHQIFFIDDKEEIAAVFDPNQCPSYTSDE